MGACDLTLDLLKFFGDERFAASGIVQRMECVQEEKIVSQGEHERFLYVVETGRVRVTGSISIEGSHRIRPGLVDLGPGAVFGELNLFEADVRSASVSAIEGCTLLRIDGQELSRFLEQNTDLGYSLLQHFFQVLNERLRKADQRIEGLFAWGLKAHGIERYLTED